jgi:AraC-like DNA-binding protein
VDKISKSTRLSAPLYVDPRCYGYCTIINNHKQMYHKHSHDYFEVFLVIDGSAMHTVNDSSFLITKGSLVFIRPDDEHCYTAPMSNDFRFINMIIVPDLIMQLSDFLGEGYDMDRLIKDEYPTQRDLLGTAYEPLASTLEELMIFPKSDVEKYNTAFKMAVVEIASLFFHESKLDDRRTYPKWLRHLLLEIQKPENYAEGLQAMYRISACTPEHLCRSFRKYLHTTPTAFLNELRVEEAARRIIYTNDPIIDICNDVGFDNLSHFYHLFKAHYNMSPGMYRKTSRMGPAPEA